MEPESDICLVLEGTYPFVMGGVSSWVHQLVRDLPELRFHLWFIAPDLEAVSGEPVYKLPPNVTGLTTVTLHGPTETPPRATRRTIAAWADFLPRITEVFRGRGAASMGGVLREIARRRLGPAPVLEVLTHERAWDHLVDVYREEAAHESFATFFWTWMNSMQPILRLLMSRIPVARAYHTVSTGYAGMLAARAGTETGAPMILTEHGIYTKERRIEINQADWIPERPRISELADRQPPYFRGWWVRLFEGMSRFVYDAAHSVLTIHEGNTVLQRRDGADPGKIRVIPNGVDVTRIREAAENRPRRTAEDGFTIGFIGRVAPIKDIETLLDSMALVKAARPDARLRIMGPASEDPEYAARCEDHLRRLGLGAVAAFEGTVDIAQVLPEIDVLVLTSISEAQPLVLLEAGAAGIPVVATDVGACRELVGGRTPADRALGPGGLITPIGSPRATADALLALAADPGLRRTMGLAGRARVEQFYTQGQMIDAYRATYGELLERAEVL